VKLASPTQKQKRIPMENVWCGSYSPGKFSIWWSNDLAGYDQRTKAPADPLRIIQVSVPRLRAACPKSRPSSRSVKRLPRRPVSFLASAFENSGRSAGIEIGTQSHPAVK